MTAHGSDPLQDQAVGPGDGRDGRALADAVLPPDLSAVFAAGRSVAIAESLTGGLVLAEIVGTPGASAVLRGGVVAYDTELKRRVLGVDAALLAERGPVDPRVAREMARGVRRVCATEGGEAAIGISTTGVAGPSADPQTGTAVGTVFIGVSSARGERAIALNLDGDRAEIRAKTVCAALSALAEETVFLDQDAHS
ncbi:CinA family protein [Mycetocola tolaasinivorans]|uniref:CinA family protein n=1 Tax=Mycetocola tolaasinivorans TaxID=76635 RepID=A0A3L7ACT0_9MICO|nr:CinA family protein [Mycetocola tolaasinivorans]RLP77784.1 CinA family protein [Mycetocola tolaasinivorans]